MCAIKFTCNVSGVTSGLLNDFMQLESMNGTYFLILYVVNMVRFFFFYNCSGFFRYVLGCNGCKTIPFKKKV